MQLDVQQVYSYSKSVNDKAWMTIAIVEQQHNAGLRIMPSGAEDNTSDTIFLHFTLIHFIEPTESFFDWMTKRRFFVWASGKELLAMRYDYTGKHLLAS